MVNARAPGHIPATEPLQFSWNSGSDSFLGVVLVLCTVIGVPANVTAIRYFVRQYRRGRANKRFFSGVYVLITLNDFLVSLTLFPVAASLFANRKKVLFGDTAFCTIWAVVWELLPFISIFLVGLLSLTRLATLLKPNITLPLYAIPISTVLYIAILIGCKGGAIAFHYLEHSRNHCENSHTAFFYNKHSVFCFLFARGFDDKYAWTVYSISSTVFMAGPIPLILTSCLTSLYKIRQATLRAKTLSSSVRMQRQASITIVIVTLTYLIYNVPVFVNYIVYTIASFHPEVDYRKLYGSNSATFYYAWVITYIVCVALNSVTNPFVYFFRMTGYKKYVMSLVGMSVATRGFSSTVDYSSTRREPSHLNMVSLKVNPAVRNGTIGDRDETQFRDLVQE